MGKAAIYLFCLGLPSCGQEQWWRTGYYLQPADRKLPISAVPFSKYTHVVQYALLPTYNSGSNTCGVDAASYTVSANAAEFISTAHTYGTKALVSMLHDSNASAIRTCTNSLHVGQFVSVIANYINQYGYDGFDIDWEDGIIDSHYQQWIISLRAALPGKVLTVATTWNQRHALARVQDKVDQINVMNYDSDIWPSRGPRPLTSTAYNSALYQGADSDWTTADIYISYNAASAGISRSKLGLGMPFYARVKRGCRSGYSIGSTCTQGVTDPGQTYASGNAATNARAPISYSDLVNSVYWTKGTRIWDSVHGAQYIHYDGSDSSQDAFVSYTGVEQMQEAATYVRNNSLGGIMTYELTNEFLSGETGDNRYPLSSVIYQMMVGRARCPESDNQSGGDCMVRARIHQPRTPVAGLSAMSPHPRRRRGDKAAN